MTEPSNAAAGYPSAGAGYPAAMTIQRAGEGVQRWHGNVATAPILAQLLLSSQKNGEMSAMRAYFEPGVISHWHSHPLGQLLYVIDGVGLVQREGGEIATVRAGDTVWFAPGERHWHGAADGCPFSYLSVQPVQNGSATDWFAPVKR